MSVLFAVSTEERAGKTAVCAGLGRILQGNGKKVGYLRPAAVENIADSDIAFMKQALGLSEDAAMSDGRDVVLVEGMVGASPDDALSQTTYGAVREMNARVFAVEAYSENPSPDIGTYLGFGKSLAGVILNKVPRSQVNRAREDAARRLGAAGISVLGVIPEDRTLSALTVGELAESVRGKILNSPDKSDELVENYMLGAMVVDSGLDYFARKSNKAAVIRKNRPDMQLAALETSTRSLVLSGGDEEPPIYAVMERAENRQVPIISTELTSSEIIAEIEEAQKKSRLHEEKKISRLTELIRQNVDLKSLT